ncbi:MAG TPA: ABC transporter ATP-binding protein [Conexibacter sp.]|nr:ABC transporter ATP-binding protein [Conexibacter sp.]
MTGLELREVVKHYDAGELVRAVDGVSLRVGSGEVVALCGPSGSGKSTLLRMAAGIELPDHGAVLLDGRNLGELSVHARTLLLRSEIGLIPQRDSLVEGYRALANAAVRLRAAGVSRADAHEQATAWLERLGLAARAGHYPSQLSGGERQRVAIARALATTPRLILADEPTSHLDRRRGEAIVQLLADSARAHGAAVVLVTHDDRIEAFVDRVEHLEDGRLAHAELPAVGASGG